MTRPDESGTPRPTFLEEGFVMDGVEEPVFGKDTSPKLPLDWYNFHELPPVLVVRMRPSSF